MSSSTKPGSALNETGTKKPFSIANSVKPSRAPITLPTEIKPTFAAIERLQEEIRLLQTEKFGLESHLERAVRQARGWKEKFDDLSRQMAKLLSQETSGAS